MSEAESKKMVRDLAYLLFERGPTKWQHMTSLLSVNKKFLEQHFLVLGDTVHVLPPHWKPHETPMNAERVRSVAQRIGQAGGRISCREIGHELTRDDVTRFFAEEDGMLLVKPGLELKRAELLDPKMLENLHSRRGVLKDAPGGAPGGQGAPPQGAHAGAWMPPPPGRGPPAPVNLPPQRRGDYGAPARGGPPQLTGGNGMPPTRRSDYHRSRTDDRNRRDDRDRSPAYKRRRGR